MDVSKPSYFFLVKLLSSTFALVACIDVLKTNYFLNYFILLLFFFNYFFFKLLSLLLLLFIFFILLTVILTAHLAGYH